MPTSGAWPEEVPPVACHVLENRGPAVRLVTRLGHELKSDGPYAAVSASRFIDAPEEADTTGVLVS